MKFGKVANVDKSGDGSSFPYLEERHSYMSLREGPEVYLHLDPFLEAGARIERGVLWRDAIRGFHIWIAIGRSSEKRFSSRFHESIICESIICSKSRAESVALRTAMILVSG